MKYLKKTVANKLKDFLMAEREQAAIEFVKWLDYELHILPGGLDLKELYESFLRLDPFKYKQFKKSVETVQQTKD